MSQFAICLLNLGRCLRNVVFDQYFEEHIMTTKRENTFHLTKDIYIFFYHFLHVLEQSDPVYIFNLQIKSLEKRVGQRVCWVLFLCLFQIILEKQSQNLCPMCLCPVALTFDPDDKNAITPPYLIYLKSDYLPCVGVLIHPLWVITAAHCNLPWVRSLHITLCFEFSDWAQTRILPGVLSAKWDLRRSGDVQ